MKILAFSPFRSGALSGNLVTLSRIRAELVSRGHSFEIQGVSPFTREDEARSVAEQVRPDLIHFYHAYQTGHLLPHMGATASVVTLSGTDFHKDYQDPFRRTVIERALIGADQVVTYNRSIALGIVTAWPTLAAKVVVIPKGVTRGQMAFDLRKAQKIPNEAFVFFQAGGIRPTKNNLFALEGLSPLAARDPRVRLVFAGPFLDKPYEEIFRMELRARTWALSLGPMDPGKMTSCYQAADVILNTSHSEGLSNTLIEAMSAGSAVLASDVPGNRDLIEHGRTGLLYKDREDFELLARRLIEDAGFRQGLGKAARTHSARTFSTEREVDALLDVYRMALSL
jgi:glycosyltransferase involved in cell wall biosynthesis